MNSYSHRPTSKEKAVTTDDMSTAGTIGTDSYAETPVVVKPPSEKEHYFFIRKYSPRNGRTYTGVEHNFINWLIRAEQLVEIIATTDNPPFKARRDRHGRAHFKLTRLGSLLFLVLKSHNSNTLEHYKHHRFNPPLTVILDAVARCASEILGHTTQHGALRLEDQAVRDLLDTAVGAIRSKVRSQEYKKEVDNYKRNEEKNIVSCCEYMAAQFRRRSRLLILRIDLYFRPSFRDWGYTREADLHYAKLLRGLRENRIVPDVLGYIGKREDGIDRGIHFHVLIVVDGHEHRDAANLTRMIGEEWVRRCAQGNSSAMPTDLDPETTSRASYFNCYTRKDHYPFSGLGLIHPTDTEKLRGLRLAIEYMCKEATQLKPSPTKGDVIDENAGTSARKRARNLRKGIMPKGHSGRGAPRRSGLDTSAIEQELLKTQKK